MPFVLLIVGAITIASAIKGTYAELGQQIISDLKGSAGNVGYVYWVSAIIAVGAIGYYSPAQKFSRAFMFLIIIGMILATKGGIFAKLADALKNPVEATGGKTTSTSQPGATDTSGGKNLATAAATLALDEASFA